MRWLRVPLAFVLFLAVLLDLQVAGMILQHGFPPVAILESDENGRLLFPTTEDRIRWGLFIAAIGLVQIVVLWMTLKAWRQPKAAHRQASQAGLHKPRA